MKKLQYILPLIVLVIFLMLIYFALYQVEGFAISEVNNTLDAS
jgi:hypothetical protein